MTLAADIEWALADVNSRLPKYALYRQYDEGDHRLLFATDKYRNAFGDLFREFADNLCEDVVDGLADRIQITGWTTTDSDLGALVDAAWERNQGPARAGAVHRNAIREGDGFTMVDLGRDGLFRSYRQEPTQIAVRYSTEYPDEMDLAAKVWPAGKRWRMNLYYPDGKFVRLATKGLSPGGGLPGAAAFKPVQAGDPALAEDETYEGEAAIPGIPVFHYPNGDLSTYGRSILRGVIPLQDALNKGVADMLVTMEGTAQPIRWARGIETQVDPITGQEVNPFAGADKPGAVIRTGNKEAAFGQFDAASPDGFLDVQDSFRIQIARKGYLPPYAVPLRSGAANYPSGVSLLVSEGRAVKVARDRQRDWGAEHAREYAYGLSLEAGRPGAVIAADLDPTWAPPETRDEKALVEMLLLKKDLGVDQRHLLLEAGYDEADVDEMLDTLANVQEGMAAAFTVLQGGRQAIRPADAVTLTQDLGVPAAPDAPGGGQAALTS